MTELRECGPGATAAAKRLAGEVALNPIDELSAEKSAALLAQIRATDEAREGLSAFLEKRRPKWRGGEEGE